MTIQELLEAWRQHIASVAERRGRSDVYVPLETFHTCHGCGQSAPSLWDGLCDECETSYQESRK